MKRRILYNSVQQAADNDRKCQSRAISRDHVVRSISFFFFPFFENIPSLPRYTVYMYIDPRLFYSSSLNLFCAPLFFYFLFSSDISMFRHGYRKIRDFAYYTILQRRVGEAFIKYLYQSLE